MSSNKPKAPIEHVNIGEFNRGQSSKIIRGLVEDDKPDCVSLFGMGSYSTVFCIGTMRDIKHQ